MNTRRLVVLLLAAVAAGGVALLVRGLIGGGTPKADARIAPAPIAISDVLVASANLQPGQPLSVGQVRWQKWPSSNVDPSFIQKTVGSSAAAVVDGTVVRAPIMEGEPITFAKIVKSDAAGFMAATLSPGMRAVSINVSVASVAGGFILPNDRVDILLTMTTGDNPKRVVSSVVLANVRVLAIDQTAADAKSQKTSPDAKTATLELSPRQAQLVAQAQASGTLSLALRALGDNSANRSGRLASGQSDVDDNTDAGPVSIIRYGSVRRQTGGGGGN